MTGLVIKKHGDSYCTVYLVQGKPVFTSASYKIKQGPNGLSWVQV